MKTHDDLIKRALRANLQQIDDALFTNKIIENHLSKKQSTLVKPFVNFMSLIIGLCVMITGIAIVVLIRQNPGWLNDIGITESHGLLIVSISFIFLIYKWVEEFTAPNKVYIPGGHRQ